MYASALLVAGLAALSAAYTTPVGANPQGNPITKPGLNEIVPVGVGYSITWTPTSAPGTVTLVLLRGPSNNIIPLYPIIEKTPNNGSYYWTPSTTLQPDTTGYGIQLIDDKTGFYQYTSQFGISNPGFKGNATLPVSANSTGSMTTSYVLPTANTTSTCVYCMGNSTTVVGPTATGAKLTSTNVVVVTPTGTSATGASATTSSAKSTSSGAAGKVVAAPFMAAGVMGLAALIL